MAKRKRRFWESTSAADDGLIDDDGYEVVEQNDDGDWIDTFKFSDYRADRGLSSSDAIWSRYGYSGSTLGSYSRSNWGKSDFGKALGVDYATAKKVEAAQRLVQGFVDTFALDNPLKARFSDQMGSVGDEEGTKSVVISHRPLLDTTIGEQHAHRVMTAQAANAAARARYGGEASSLRLVNVSRAMQYASAGSDDRALAGELAEILDGYRIDASFRRDYPGYEDVYAPAQEYVARGMLGDRQAFALEDFAGASIANAALNYSPWTDWTGREQEREWWTDWANQFAFADTATFVKGVEAGLTHLRETLPPKPEPPEPPKGDEGGDEDEGQPSDQKGKGKGKGKGEGTGSGSGASDEQDEQPESDEQDDTDSSSGSGDDEESDEESDAKPESGKGESGKGESGDDLEDPEDWDEDGEPSRDSGGNVSLPTGLGQGVSRTGMANGQSKQMSDIDAEKLAQTAGAMAIGYDDSEVGEVYWNANGFAQPRIQRELRAQVKAESSASGYIRRAFSRSRTAHYATERGHTTGRIDNRSLPRIASDDYRLFAKRVAPSETKYRVWMLLDHSGSMAYDSVQATVSLAASVALAVRHMPNVSLDVWAWTSSLRVNGSAFSAVRVYADGDPISKIGDIGTLGQGGTPDNYVLSWAAREIRKQCRPDETPVILMASDGQGGLAGEAHWRHPARRAQLRPEQAEKYTRDRVGDARRAGIKVLSVAIGSLSEPQQDSIYGKGNHLIWNGSIKKMGKPLGDLLGRIASNRIK